MNITTWKRCRWISFFKAGIRARNRTIKQSQLWSARRLWEKVDYKP
jgi:hypothetical protein